MEIFLGNIGEVATFADKSLDFLFSDFGTLDYEQQAGDCEEEYWENDTYGFDYHVNY